MSSGPTLLVWEVTRDCPLSCLYCYNIWKGTSAWPVPGSPPDSFAVAAAIASARPATVTLTGGEPMLHAGLPGLVSLLAGRGIPVGVATSGVLLNRSRAEELVSAGVGRFEVSLPAGDRDGYMRMTRTDGFCSVKQAMLAAVASGAKLTVSHVMTAANTGETEAVIEMAFALGACAVALNRFVPGGEGSLHEMELSLTREMLHRALSAASAAAARFPVPVHVTIPVEECILPHREYPALRFTSCVCGSAKWAVDPWGRLRVCEQSPVILGSLLDQPFDDLASGPAVDSFRGACRSDLCGVCDSYGSCGGGCRFLERILP